MILKISTKELVESYKELFEVRKEDDLYFNGAFWIFANSYEDILKGDFEIDGTKLPVNFDGEYYDKNDNKQNITHKKLWEKDYQNQFKDKSYTYFPRGRVNVYKGVAYVNIHSKCNLPKVINAILREYNVQDLELDLGLNDIEQGSHYDFELE